MPMRSSLFGTMLLLGGFSAGFTANPAAGLEYGPFAVGSFVRMAADDFRLSSDFAEARYDGKFVLRTNTDLPSAEVARAYKKPWRLGRTFRKMKSTLEVRPIFHNNDETVIGHIVAGFLAWRLEVNLRRRSILQLSKMSHGC